MEVPKDCKPESGQFIPIINRNRCEGKSECVTVCPYSVFTVGMLPPDQRRGMSFLGQLKGAAHQWQQAILAQPDDCHACGKCVAACPEKALTLARASGTRLSMD